MVVEPGAVNVIPGVARLSIDVRHASDPIRTGAVAEIRRAAGALASRRGVEFLVAQNKSTALPSRPIRP